MNRLEDGRFVCKDELRATITALRAEIARLAARVAYLEQENLRLVSTLLRREGEIEAESRRER